MGKPDSKQQAAPNSTSSQAAAAAPPAAPPAAAASRPGGVAATNEPTCRGPYTPFPFTLPHVYLEVSIQPGATKVISVVDYVPLQPSSNSSSSRPQQCLALRGEDLEILELSLDGEVLPEGAYTWEPEGCELVVHCVPPKPFQLRCVTAIHPEQHTDLEGLFCVGGVYATQCEATQFSLLTVFPDRPDILSCWRVRLEAPQASCPVLLSNGNMVEAGELQGGRHFAVWEDPYPKPCYLFSVVAGDLALREATHTTHTGRDVRLQIYVPPAYIEQLGEAVTAIKAAMTWDEAAFGREYDLDTYTMVGLEGFNDDATETKGISLFSIHILAACPTANTDEEVEVIRSLVAHEYFHNWSGNRVTLRDWLNLTVKEGLTVYREQQFMADLDAAAAAVTAPYGSTDWEPELLSHLYRTATASSGNAPEVTATASQGATAAAAAAGGGLAASGAVVHTGGVPGCSWRRVLEAGYLREEQWPEDDGPLAHPIRPSQVKSLCSLYTDTVYAKGAAVVRMFRFLLGPRGFTNGVQAFFDSNDGKAVPCEAFCEALCAANPTHAGLLRGLLPWYDTPGTPTLTINSSYSPSSESLTLTIKQRNDTAREVDKALYKPLLIPVKIGLVGPDGCDMPLHLKPLNSSSTKHKSSSKVGDSKPRISPEGVITDTGLQGSESTSVVLLVDGWSQSFTFTRLPEKPCVSLLRDFSAPVRLDVEGETDRSLGFLAVHDSNPFARWDALQRLLCRLLTRLYDMAEEQGDSIDDMESLGALLAQSGAMPPALVAALEAALAAEDLDGEYQAQLLQLPSVAQVVSLLDEPDPVLLWMVWVHVGQQLARSLEQQLQHTIRQCDAQLQQLDAGFGPAATKARALENAALGLLCFNWDEQLEQQVLERYYSASCMTDRLAALELLVDEDSPARTAALQHFHDTYSSQPLAMLKWLYVQAASDLEGNVQNVAALMKHPVFDITNPQACEHLLWGFAASVPNFHEEDGSGYAFLADAILKVDKVNTQMAASLVTTLVDWEAFDEDRQQLMLAQLKRFTALGDKVSEDVMEVVRQAIRD